MRDALTTLRHKILPRTLFGRSLMIIATPMLLMQVIVSFVFFDRHWDSINNRLVFGVAGEIGMVYRQITDAQTAEDVQRAMAGARRYLDLGVSIEPLDERVFLKPSPPFSVWRTFNLGSKLDRHLQDVLGDRDFVVHSAEDNRYFMVAVRLDDGQMAVFLCPDRRLTSSTTYIFLLWLMGSAVVLFTIAIIFMRNQIRPIRKLAIAAEKLGKGQDVGDFRPVGAREVRQAARAFVQMKERLRRQMEQRTAMLSGVSHDLRTPLTRMKLELAMSAGSATVENLRQDVEEMERMLEGYLAFARGEGSETPEMTDVQSILDRVIAGARRQGAVIDDSGQKTADRPMLRLRPMAMERAISNIVSNACKYATQVWVSVDRQGDELVMTVDDNGAGIPPDAREDVFRPFFRLEKSRNKKTGGVGLGLAIARDVVHAHGGEITLHDSPQGGLRVVVRLPV